jgi:hypothetical protein
MLLTNDHPKQCFAPKYYYSTTNMIEGRITFLSLSFVYKRGTERRSLRGRSLPRSPLPTDTPRVALGTGTPHAARPRTPGISRAACRNPAGRHAVRLRRPGQEPTPSRERFARTLVPLPAGRLFSLLRALSSRPLTSLSVVRDR